MSSDTRFSVFFAIAFSCLVTAASTSPASSQLPQPSPSPAGNAKARAELSRAFAGVLSDTSSHMRMGPTRAATVTDSARAAAIVVAARAALGQYTDVKVAERDGYYRNMPWLEEQPIYHYNNSDSSNVARQGKLDVTKPLSLLYRKDERGQLRLIGAMYATGASATPEDLDALLPTSMAHWHEHVNLCYPSGMAARRATQGVDAGTVFVFELFLSMTSASQCESAGGRFVPVEGGWMTHVYMFAGSDDPKMIWDADDAGNMGMQMRHPPTEPRR
jgi:hypothetical protein